MLHKAKQLAANLRATADAMTKHVTVSREFFDSTASILNRLISEVEKAETSELPPGITVERTYVTPDGKRYASLEKAEANLEKARLVAVLLTIPNHLPDEEKADKLLTAFNITPKE